MEDLYRLAELFGVQTSYYDVSGTLIHASPDSLVRILQALGAEINQAANAPDGLRRRRQYLAERLLEPVSVVWGDTASEICLHIPADRSSLPLDCALRLETGEVTEWSLDAAQLPAANYGQADEFGRVQRTLPLRAAVPPGYHQLVALYDSRTVKSTIISSPVQAYQPAVPSRKRWWGAFLPLYSLYSERSWGLGDFTDLEQLIDWIASLGGDMVATLPLLAAFLDEPFEPGPYSPASRLFWNELYLDPMRIPEYERSPAAQKIVNSEEFRAEVADLRRASLIDYRRQMALKKRVLIELARSFDAGPGDRLRDFQSFVTSHPQVEDYACFRAVGEKLRAPWPAWPDRLQSGSVAPGDYDEEVKRYHLYVQWQADLQLHQLASKARGNGLGLYLDLPLGVNPDSYDIWRERDSFAHGISAGAPPDPFFAKGQNWGFPPLHPEQIRANGYKYIRAYIQHHVRLASVLRIDHMMGLHRLFWIPHGMEAREGIYVRYPAEELYAIYCLESHRHRSILVGEDLGTVPPEVPAAMARHNVRRMYVLQFMLQPNPQNAIQPAPAGCFANINTHDLPPFAAFWNGLDIEDRIALGALDRSAAGHEHWQRQSMLGALVQFLQSRGRLQDDVGPLAVLKQCLSILCADSASAVLANLEDFWLETQTQNVPGTWHERPNWRRKAQHSLETIKRMPEVRSILEEMNRAAKS
jgi:4-alpha-glucanotransferase